ncbi:MAG TPA: SCO family protein [Pyrinomonadaceae bacterium]
MQDLVITGPESEQQFALFVDGLTADPNKRGELIDLLREDHSLYDGRGTNAVVRMRGWVLLSLARVGLTDDALVFVLEELDTGIDPYLIAAASRALRSYSTPQAAFAPFVMRALTHIRYRDDPVSLERYGKYAVGSSGTSAVRELLHTLVWLGPKAKDVLAEIEALRKEPSGLSRKFKQDLDRVVTAIQVSDAGEKSDCCALPDTLGQMFSWTKGSRRSCASIESTTFQDQSGDTVTYDEFFTNRPSIVVFFYTRCDNPLKCSLTITKLCRIQNLLLERGLNDQIQTAAITYDPAFDLPERIHSYGENRGVTFGERHRMLRAIDGFDAVRKHFELGVNFVESLVNRHRVEVYVLDSLGRVAASFERLHWDEHEVVRRATEVLQETKEPTTPATHREDINATRKITTPLIGTYAALGLALFPKCPLCWASYMSLFGIVGLEGIPYSPWLQPLLAVVIAINLASVWLRARATGRMMGFILVSAGALTLVLSKATGLEKAAVWGVLLTLAGSFLSTLTTRNGTRETQN